ncbi:efflux RND transporter periplasmic adaptor subunit [Paraburkholderia sp. NMBU_R16]|uniref:efflux RND transporter periplasmic adaptor subunit n=1 Tax=Paraburkholderia sp. NMBU_R16 TaxID=2698676 RepID=UPI00349F2821
MAETTKTTPLPPLRKSEAPAGSKPVVSYKWHLAIWLAVVAVCLAGGGAAWWLMRTAVPVHYVSLPVTRGNVTRSVTATGTVNPVLTIIIGSYVSGVIQSQYCDFNTRVHKGQVCAKIDPRPYQTIVDQHKADLLNARAQLIKDQAALAYAKVAYERDAALLTRGIVSQDTVDNAKSIYGQAVAQIAVDRSIIEQRAAALESAQVNLDYTNIVSPVDGTVVSRNVTIGQTVAASFQTPTLFLIATDLTQMEVDTNVSESDVGGVREGDKASFTVEAYPKRSFEGKVVQVRQAPQTVQNVVTYDVVIGAANEALLLKPGMTATTRIVIEQRENVVRVPDQALRFSPAGVAKASSSPAGAPLSQAGAGTARVWVLRDGHPVSVVIRTGLDDDTHTEVLAGSLKPGDLAIVAEQHDTATESGAASGPRLFRF